jgi:hypothetical protein
MEPKAAVFHCNHLKKKRVRPIGVYKHNYQADWCSNGILILYSGGTCFHPHRLSSLKVFVVSPQTFQPISEPKRSNSTSTSFQNLTYLPKYTFCMQLKRAPLSNLRTSHLYYTLKAKHGKKNVFLFISSLCHNPSRKAHSKYPSFSICIQFCGII